MTELPRAAELRLPAGAVIAVPADGLAVFRLVRNDPPEASDFRPQAIGRARDAGWPELLRLGLSHFLRIEAALAARRMAGSMLAEVQLRPESGIHLAGTAGRWHVTVWAPAETLILASRVVD